MSELNKRGDRRGKWRSHKTPEQLAATSAKSSIAHRATWDSLSAESKAVVVQRLSWACRLPRKTNAAKGMTLEQRYGEKRACEMRAASSARMLVNPPMRNPASVEQMRAKRRGAPSANKGREFPQLRGNRNPSKRPEVRAKISAAKKDRHSGGRQYSGQGFREDLGQFYRSRWEANFARVLRLKNIAYEYEPGGLPVVVDGVTAHYRPDFLLTQKNVYVEIKGYLSERAAAKLKAFAEQYPELRLIMVGRSQYAKLLKNFGSRLALLETTRKDPLETARLTPASAG